MLATSLGVWTLAAGALTWFAATTAQPLLLGYGGFVLQLLLGVAATWTAAPAPSGSRPVSTLMLLARGTLAGGAIVIALLIGRSGAGIAAGMASIFPAIFLTSMVGVWHAQGRSVSGGAVGPMALGSAAVSGFALLARWLIPETGLLSGVLLAWVLAVGSITLPARVWLSTREVEAHRIH